MTLFRQARQQVFTTLERSRSRDAVGADVTGAAAAGRPGW